MLKCGVTLASILICQAPRNRCVAGAALGEGAVDLHAGHDASAPTVLVLGSEGAGMRTTVQRECSMLVCVPRAGAGGALHAGLPPGSAEAVDSLNVSVAGGLLLHALMSPRQRAAEDAPSPGAGAVAHATNRDDEPIAKARPAAAPAVRPKPERRRSGVFYRNPVLRRRSGVFRQNPKRRRSGVFFRNPIRTGSSSDR